MRTQDSETARALRDAKRVVAAMDQARARTIEQGFAARLDGHTVARFARDAARRAAAREQARLEGVA